ncbi:MAG TPA: DUF3052 domain-containing protein [Acidimicrobiales bacterium]
MDGNSGAPLATMLGVHPGEVAALLHAPDVLEFDLPDGVTRKHRAVGRADMVVHFVIRPADLDRRIDRLAAMVRPARGLRIAWLKRASGMPTDVTEYTVRDLAVPRGIVNNKACAVDTNWTGLRIVWRVENRWMPCP